ncbi:MAG: DUF2849 domain-containing protein [Rhodobacteraceae bacterium]|nr:DUF2849 domain-containing protein [Paracoccaceae bacterium]
MPRRFTPKVITSNHLLRGDTIYLSPSGGWVDRFQEAKVFVDEAEATQTLADIDLQRDVHVGAYLADANVSDRGVPRPAHFRERFRDTGPSNYFHGKQADL